MSAAHVAGIVFVIAFLVALAGGGVVILADRISARHFATATALVYLGLIVGCWGALVAVVSAAAAVLLGLAGA